MNSKKIKCKLCNLEMLKSSMKRHLISKRHLDILTVPTNSEVVPSEVVPSEVVPSEVKKVRRQTKGKQKKLKPPFGRVGGKNLLKHTIIKELPENYEEMTYVEAFVGGGSVFYAKQPSVNEVINDLDNLVYTVHNGLKQFGDDEKIDKIRKEYTKDDFYEFKNNKPIEPVDIFIRQLQLFKLSFMSRGNTPDSRMEIKMTFNDYKKRLENTEVRNESYEKLIEEFDSENTIFYLDPPYEKSKRNHYKHNDFDLKKCEELLRDIKGKFVLSMNDSENVRDIFKDYNIIDVSTKYTFQHLITELVIKNF